MLRIRLRRVGKKGQAYYRVVVADQRAPRDGAFLETLGAYNPHLDPPVADLNEARAREWLDKGAQPSEAVEKILRRVGVIEGGAGTAVAEPPPEAEAEVEAEARDEDATAPVAEAEAPVEAEAEAEAAAEPTEDAPAETETASEAEA